jgi:catalase
MVLDRMPENFFAETEQVAFMTQNIVPGIDFTDDPLLQGRNFSYLDTQLKRLGGPNFTHLPINAPKCPFHVFQQDGHMAFHNPKGRANYEPNSWGQKIGGPRESPEHGFTTFAQEPVGPKVRLRPESFADHYSQARLFYVSQTKVEQKHIADALVFELSKCEMPAIRERIVAHLFNVDQGLAETVAGGLGLSKLPKASPAAVVPRLGLAPSDALSILKRGPSSFKGRKLGVLMTDGLDARLLSALEAAAKKEGATVERVALAVSGVKAYDGSVCPAHYKIDGAPSVLFDAVAVLASKDGATALANRPSARDFVSDAYAHYKFIGFTPDAVPLLTKIGLAPDHLDEGFVRLGGKEDVEVFTVSCRKLRFWERPDGA